MDDLELREALRELPRVSPPTNFTETVLSRLRAARSSRRPAPVWLAPVLVAAAVLVAGVGLRRAERLRRAQSIRDETRSISREVDALKRTLPSPVIDLGEKDGVRYVLDLRRLPGYRGGTL